jgi:hypothetical protein
MEIARSIGTSSFSLPVQRSLPCVLPRKPVGKFAEIDKNGQMCASRIFGLIVARFSPSNYADPNDAGSQGAACFLSSNWKKRSSAFTLFFPARRNMPGLF